MSYKINLKDLDKAAVLAALYNASKPQGMGFLHCDPTPMTVEEARELLKRTTNFDYLKGRVMKVDLSGDTLDPWGYDRDNGQGAAWASITSLQSTGNVNNDAIAKGHSDRTFLSAVKMESHLGDTSGLVSDPCEQIAVFHLGVDDLREQLEPKVKKAKEDNKDKQL